MKLKKPLTLSSEAQYLTHCNNIAIILTHTAGTVDYRLSKYFELTGAELEKSGAEEKNSGRQKYCPKCDSFVEFAQDPLRVCNVCGWTGDYTKLVER